MMYSQQFSSVKHRFTNRVVLTSGSDASKIWYLVSSLVTKIFPIRNKLFDAKYQLKKGKKEKKTEAEKRLHSATVAHQTIPSLCGNLCAQQF